MAEPRRESQVNSVPGPTVARRIRPVTALGCALLAGVALAASDDGHREHDPHEHGRGMLDIVLEGEELVAELRIPAVNVVGFEHAPGDDAEREAVREAVARFANAAAVLVPTADAECELEDVEAEIAGTDHDGRWRVGAQGIVEEGHEGEDHDEEGHAKHEHEEDEHEEGHAKHEHEEDEHEDAHAKHEHEEDEHEEGHAKHEHEEDAGESGAEAHAELHATYRFHCHAPGRLARIDVRVFELLHEAEEIGVRVVTPTAQTAMDLHPGETVVEISP